MKNKVLWIAGFSILLMAAFYFFLFAGTDYYKSKLPVLSYVKDFRFTDQDGKQLSQRQVEGKRKNKPRFLGYQKIPAGGNTIVCNELYCA